jgi:hypothetical protein
MTSQDNGVAVAPDSQATIDLEAANRRANDARTRAERLTADLRMLADALRDEAISRGWCGEYGTFVDRVNSRMSEEWLQHCLETYEFTYQVRIRVEGRAGTSEEVNAELRSYLDDLEFELESGTVEGMTVRLIG